MKLLFVHDRVGSLAGAESNLFHTATELGRCGHELGLLHGPGTGKEEQAWCQLFPARFRFAERRSAAGVHEALAEFSPDLVYLHNPPDLPAVAALAESGAPVVRMVHDHRLFCLRGCKYPLWSRQPCVRAFSPFCVFPCGGLLTHPAGSRRWSLNWNGYSEKKRELELHRGFRRLVVGSHYMRAELLINGFSSEQIEVLAPVPPTPSGGVVSPGFGEQNLIVYAGQVIRGKGLDVLLETLTQVRAPFQLVVLGDGHHRRHCEVLVRRLGLADRVRFEGHVSQSVLAQFYREATLAVVCSVWPEPFGATGLEAMRCGLPVVAFDAGGIGEWLHDGVNGYLIPWMDRAQYARRVEMLLADKSLARWLGAQGRALAEDRFHFGRYVRALEQLFVRVSAEPIPEAAA